MNENSTDYSFDGLDRVFHEKARLSIMTSLTSHPKGLAFGELKQLCALTDGNLSRHLKVLQETGVVEIEKGYEKNRPLTTCRLSPIGKKRFLEYVNLLEAIVKEAADAMDKTQTDLSVKPKTT